MLFLCCAESVPEVSKLDIDAAVELMAMYFDDYPDTQTEIEEKVRRILTELKLGHFTDEVPGMTIWAVKGQHPWLKKNQKN